MLSLFTLLAQAPPAPDAMAPLQALLEAWAVQDFPAFVHGYWPEARPTSRVVALPAERWGPDAILGGGSTCEASHHGDPTENGLRQAEIEAARARVGPDWASAPTGFTAPGVRGWFDAHEERAWRHEDFTVSITRLPTGTDPVRLFDAGLAHGCTLSKLSDAWMWSGDLLVRVMGPCADAHEFDRWIGLVMAALPRWSGAPVGERYIAASCGMMGMPWRETPAAQGPGAGTGGT